VAKLSGYCKIIFALSDLKLKRVLTLERRILTKTQSCREPILGRVMVKMKGQTSQSKIIQIDEDQIKGHLNEVVKGTLEVIHNGLL
jgi:hypothetical protein